MALLIRNWITMPEGLPVISKLAGLLNNHHNSALLYFERYVYVT